MPSDSNQQTAKQKEVLRLLELQEASQDRSKTILTGTTAEIFRRIEASKESLKIANLSQQAAQENLVIQKQKYGLAAQVADRARAEYNNAVSIGLVDQDSLDILERKANVFALVARRRSEELDSAKAINIQTAQSVIAAERLVAQLGRKAPWEVVKSGIFGAVEGSEKLVGLFKDLTSNPLQAFAALIKLAFDRFVELDKAAEAFRKTTGLTINQTGELRKNAELLNMKYQDMGVSIEEAYKSTEALVSAFGGLAIASVESTETVALLSANLGVAAENAADVLNIFSGLGGVSEKVANNMLKAGMSMTKGTPVSFAKVMEDIAKSSNEVHTLLGSNPQVLLKTAIAARALGTTINNLASMAKKLLDFQSSINDEMEASALIGVSLNFQRARQLSFDGKLADAAKESLRVVKQAGDWNKMNVFQREALAKASGMELKDLNKMVALDRIRNSGTAEGAKLKALDAQLEVMNKINMSDEERLVNEAEEEIKTRQMQGVMTNLGNMLKSIFMEVANVLTPIVKVLVTVMVPVLKAIGLIVKSIGVLLSPIGELFEWIDKNIGSISNGLNSVSSWLDKMQESLKGSNILIKVLATAAGLLAASGALYLANLIKINAQKRIGALLDRVAGARGAAPAGGAIPSAATRGLSGITGGIGNFLRSGASTVKAIMTAIAGGVAAFGKPDALKGALGMLIIAAAFGVLAYGLSQLKGMDWEVIAAALIGTAVAVIAVGTLLTAGIEVIGPAILILLALGASMVLIAYSFKILGEAIAGISAGLNSFATIEWSAIFKGAVAMEAMALAAATAGLLIAPILLGAFGFRIIGSAIESLAGLSSDLTKTATAIGNITSAFSEFSMVDKFTNSISLLADSIDKLNKSLSEISMVSMGKMIAISAFSPRKSNESVIESTPSTSTQSTPVSNQTQAQPNNKDIVERLDTLIALLVSNTQVNSFRVKMVDL